ncbi:hypothetical protein [Pedobacter sp. KLB.chiD]|uniref:hypothetical protein n=1 Tax=Pedobacter sp. KLB.chiD TaxID=3387402 RepID=UPI003999E207
MQWFVVDELLVHDLSFRIKIPRPFILAGFILFQILKQAQDHETALARCKADTVMPNEP